MRNRTMVPRPSVERMRIVPLWSSVKRFCNRQPQTGALMALGQLALDLLERPAKPGQRVFRDAYAAIGDGNANPFARRPARMVMRPPSGVNFTALERRLSAICFRSR